MAQPWIRNERGFDGLTLISALHKSVRRSDAEAALTWAIELLEGGWSALLLNRLTVILHEDCGVNDIASFNAAHACIADFHGMWEAKKNGHRLPLANALLAMCRAKKARDADSLVAKVLHARLTEPPRAFPDWVTDHHTRAGRQQGRTEAECAAESYRILPEDYSDLQLKAAGRVAFGWEQETGRSLDEKAGAIPRPGPNQRLPEQAP